MSKGRDASQAVAAQAMKEEGNRLFQAGDFVGAEAQYSKAILADSRNPALYTNRALARLKLELWYNAIADCQECIHQQPDNMKAHYYMAQAQLSLNQPDEALASALAAHKLCAQTNDRSLAAVTTLVLRCKHERWELKEKQRLRQSRQLEREVLELNEQNRAAMLAEAADDEERREIEEDANERREQIIQVFDSARGGSEKKREVPDWAIDDISFGIMIDPVVTKSGKSYERASILEHLRRHPTDPITREPLHVSDLRPNLDLKRACEDFLEKNGWAADW